MTYAEARIHEVNAKVAAINAEIEAMKAANEQSDTIASKPYGEGAFERLASDLRSLALEIRGHAERLQ